MARRVEDMLGSARQDSLAARLEREAELVARARRALRGRRRRARRGRRAGRGARAADARRGRRGRRHRRSCAPARARRPSSRPSCASAGEAGHRGRGPGRPPARPPRRGGRRARADRRAARARARARRASRWPTSERDGDRAQARAPRRAAASSSARSTRSPSASTRRRSRTSRASRRSAPTSRRRSSELQGLIRETDRKIHAALRGDLRGDAAQLRGAGRAPVPRRPRPPAPGRRPPRPEAGAGRRRGRRRRGREPSDLGDAGRRGPSGRTRAEERGAALRSGDEFSTQGVEIEVTPAGKATRRLSLLSGGEKALVALAFVFAVFLARPSPFYILDEVEAALDDANIDRFLQLVHRFSDRAQFIIVTHQKRTMDAADVLYGVSMGKGGVTKVVSRRFEDEPSRRRSSDDERSRLSSLPLRWSGRS